MDAGEYLFDKLKLMVNVGMLGSERWLMPIDKSEKPLKLAIFGGGNVGRDYFIQSMRRNDISIACWVDRDYEKIGFPLQSPDVLKKTEYDLVLIAVMDEKTAGSIRKDLIKLGIPDDKVVWNAPERI